MKKNFFVPTNIRTVSEDNVWRWYCNIIEELKEDFLSKEDKKYLTAYYREAGLLRPWRRPFFRHHYSGSFTHAVQHLFRSVIEPQILDLGCGTGTQSLLLSLLGAKVTALDMDETALAILKKRKFFYENLSGRRLDIKVHAGNAFEFDYESIAPIHGVYSMFAFNMMKPPEILIEKIMRHAAHGCSIGILDGNKHSWLPRLVPGRQRGACLGPIEMEQILRKYQCETVNHSGGFAIPPFFWYFVPSRILEPLDGFLGRSWFMAISHQILARKTKGMSSFLGDDGNNEKRIGWNDQNKVMD